MEVRPRVSASIQHPRGQEGLCTWCRRRLNLDKYVQDVRNGGHDQVLQVKLSTLGLGADPEQRCASSMRNVIEKLPFSLTVGTTPLAYRFWWDLTGHLSTLSSDQLEFWKSLRDDEKGIKRIKFSPRDIVAAIQQETFPCLCTWKGCLELKEFVIQAVHEAPHGIAPMPYHIVFLNFDLMDGSDRDEDFPCSESWLKATRAEVKHHYVCAFLDWIVRHPLLAAHDKHRRRVTGEATSSPSRSTFTSIQKLDHRERVAQRNGETVQCENGCGKSGPRSTLAVCGQCKSVHYCCATCQRTHWKTHKKQCKELVDKRKVERKQDREKDERQEQKKAYDLMYSAWDS